METEIGVTASSLPPPVCLLCSPSPCRRPTKAVHASSVMMTEQPHAPIFPVRHIGGTVLNFLRFLSLVVALLTFVLVSQPTLDNKHRRSCLASGRSVSGWGLVTYGAVVLQPNRFRFRSILRKVPCPLIGAFISRLALVNPLLSKIVRLAYTSCLVGSSFPLSGAPSWSSISPAAPPPSAINMEVGILLRCL